MFELIKKFTPQKSIDKTGLLIEPHFLERPKFKRHHPITSRPQYEGTIQEVTASFHKKSWTGQSGSGTTVLYWTVPMDAPTTLYYQCTLHAAMQGQINIVT